MGCAQFSERFASGRLEGGLNTYAYVGGNPVNYFDPFGLDRAQSWGQGGAVVGGAIALGGSVVVDAATGGVNVIATPGEVAAGAAAGAAFGSALGTAVDKFCKKDDNHCEELNATDTATCNGITRVRGAVAGRACHASASERYAACLRGKPLPDLNTWNH